MTSSSKIAIVTGAGSGIGKASALALMKDGWSVVFAGRRKDMLEAAANEGKAAGAKSLVVPTDVSNPEAIKALFASTKDARARGLTASHFSFNVPGGRCEACEGEGEVKVEMQFLADVFVPCEVCEGKRFKPQVLEVRYRGRSVDQVLDMTVREALTFFSTSPKVLRRLRC